MASSGKQSPKLDPSAAFGQLLRKYRLRQKMSQEALAARSGYERAFISLIELGKTNPSLRSIFDICGSLGMKPSAFLRQVEQLSGFELPSSGVRTKPRAANLIQTADSDFCAGERANGHQRMAAHLIDLISVVAVAVLVSTLVSTWCPPKPKIGSTAAKR